MSLDADDLLIGYLHELHPRISPHLNVREATWEWTAGQQNPACSTTYFGRWLREVADPDALIKPPMIFTTFAEDHRVPAISAKGTQ